ncbi:MULTISPECIES: serine hydrolase [unclassified Halomonas]|uniref:serine hydrolase n=1 Tax=unclassified Halomonas TaxID=2609666 RepID=UPI00288554F1|nr:MULTISPECIES: serine hydrolase [unclassified Halomonas]MDT0500027.1 serine hydrolase [Halomonas sp. PAR7]MDT0512431.1 serine hydrolase [Halomonas sp. LES1]MDT0591065.1 serine hydrolase [Halomonas sp. PAR8]
MVTAIMAMGRSRLLAFGLLVSLAVLLAGVAQANPRYAAIVVDVESGEILHAANAEETRYPASLTKMMTLYLLFEALEDRSLSLHHALAVSSYAAGKPASKLYVKAGSTIPVETAIEALIIKSANDVAVVVAEALGGSEANFARMMTDKARELGMSRTTFRNANGLPDAGQTTTARDMATLSLRLMQDFPQYYHYFSRTSFDWKGKTITGHNRLLDNYAGADGLKTGFIRASGFNVATSAVRDGRRLVSVVMGGFTAASRDAHMADLLNRGFVRASLFGRGDWVAQADFSGERMDLPRAAPVPSRTLPSAPPAVQVASRQTPEPAARVTRRLPPEPAVQVASLEAPEPLPRAASALPETAQGSANDPIRELISQADAPVSRTTQRLEPLGPSGSWGIQVGAFSSPDNARNLAGRAADRLASDLANARVDVHEVPGPQSLFRARLVNLDENQAYRACRSLVRDGIDCMVVNATL